jgi:NAD(P)-dependent dehydrogenase (short-subunit alcohol dehydrogenase family)
MLTGQVAVVTGASRGLGQAGASALAAAGARVALLARDIEAIVALADKICSGGGHAIAVRTDIARGWDIPAAFDRVERELGTPRILVNNAGIQHQGDLVETGLADWESVFSTNVFGALGCIKEFVQRLGEREGSIINITSIVVASAVRGQSAYSASKGALDAVTRALAVELAPLGVRVNAIAPGYFDTDMPAEVTSDPEQLQRLLRRVPLRRLGEPAEIGPLAVYLASEASSFMTGQSIYLDGGYSAK